jgi:hypothetical protein
MAHTGTAILHTPWDCKWSRFARRTKADEKRGGLWECLHSGEPVPVADADCETCPFWEYQPPSEGLVDRADARSRALATARAARRVEAGIRLSLIVIAAIFAACGVVVLTEPLMVPLTISLWLGAMTSLMLGIWGNFRSHADGSFQGFLPPRA